MYKVLHLCLAFALTIAISGCVSESVFNLSIPFETIRQSTSGLCFSETKIVQKGKAGSVVYHLEVRDASEDDPELTDLTDEQVREVLQMELGEKKRIGKLTFHVRDIEERIDPKDEITAVGVRDCSADDPTAR